MKSIRHTIPLILLLSGVLNAAHLASADFMGFSDDGRFAAFEQYWIQDGSGFPEAEIMVLSVNDSRVIELFNTRWNEELMFVDGVEMYFENTSNPARVSVNSDAEALLDSLSISSENIGTHCISHRLTDTGVKDESVTFVSWIGSMMWNGPEYNLNIVNHEVTLESPSEWLSMFDTPVLLEVMITNANGDEVMHHLDDSPQPRFEYVSNYRISDVYVYNDSLIAIILNTTEPGFEGTDGMFRMVTGVIVEMD